MSLLIRKTSYFYTIINDWYQIDPAESEKMKKICVLVASLCSHQPILFPSRFDNLAINDENE